MGVTLRPEFLLILEVNSTLKGSSQVGFWGALVTSKVDQGDHEVGVS